jgi:ssDNA-binding Zn-finger/Zn-ribbon topoisomerase 1
MNFRGGLPMEDKKIICKDCGKEFIFTVGEQEFFKEKGFDNDPVRCPDCRRARKAEKMNRR